MCIGSRQLQRQVGKGAEKAGEQKKKEIRQKELFLFPLFLTNWATGRDRKAIGRFFEKKY